MSNNNLIEKGFPATTEHNIACDIQAARIVFSSRIPKTIVPINITSQASIERSEFEVLKSQSPLEQAVSKLVDVWFNFRDSSFKRYVEKTCMHDPLTVFLVTNPELARKIRTPVYVNEQGLTKIGRNNFSNIYVSLNKAQFKTLFLSQLRS